MPTLVKSYIANDGVNPGGYDYVFTSLANWWADTTNITGDITAAGRDELHIAYVKTELNTATALLTLLFSDVTTDTTHFYTITAEPGGAFLGDASDESVLSRLKHRITTNAFYCVVKNLAFVEGAYVSLNSFSTVNGNLFTGYRITGNYNKTDVLLSVLDAVGVQGSVICNNVIKDVNIFTTGSNYSINLSGIWSQGATGDPNYVYNNVLYGFSKDNGAESFVGLRIVDGTGAAFAHNNTLADIDGTDITGSGTTTHNATDESSMPGSDNELNIVVADEWEDASSLANLNVRLKSDSSLRDAGLDLVGSVLPITDIDGTDRPIGSSWDIGVIELVAVVEEVIEEVEEVIETPAEVAMSRACPTPSQRGSVLDFVGRKIDLLAYHGARANGEILLDPTFAEFCEAGRVTAGTQKLAQRFVVELFRETGSTPFWPLLGTTFLTEARFGSFRTPSDVLGAFARGVAQLRPTLQSAESDTDPDDERFVNVEALNVELLPGRAIIRALLISRAGRDRAFIFPITVSNIPSER